MQGSLSNVAAERAILAGIFRHGSDVFMDVCDIIQQATFSVDENATIFRCISEIFNAGHSLDIPSILSKAEELGLGEYFTKHGVIEHLRAIAATHVEASNVRKHAMTIKRLQFARELQDAARESYNLVGEVDGSESLSKILATAEGPLQELALKYQGVNQENPISEIKDDIGDYVTHLEESEIGSAGICSGFPIWDDAIGGGLNRKCVDLVNARLKVGKSMMVDNVAMNVGGVQQIPVLVLDTEMSKNDHYNRLLAYVARIDSKDIKNKKYRLDPENIKKVRDAAKYLSTVKYSFKNIAGMHINEALILAKRWLIKNVGFDANGNLKDCLIIYDYIQVTDASEINDSNKEYQVLGFYTKALHNFAVVNDCPILAFCQSNRAGAEDASSTSIGGSDRIAQVATSISHLMKKSDEEIAEDGQEAGDRKLVISDCRHGAGLPNDFICLRLEGQYSKLTEIGTRNALWKQRNSRRRSSQSEIPDKEEGEADCGDVRDEGYTF